MYICIFTVIGVSGSSILLLCHPGHAASFHADGCSSASISPTLQSARRRQKKRVEGRLLLFKGMTLKFPISLLLSSYWSELGHIANQLVGNLGKVVFNLDSHVSHCVFIPKEEGENAYWKSNSVFLTYFVRLQIYA